MHARIAGLIAILAASALHAAESERWQVVRAGDVKVGHVQIRRIESDSGIAEIERLEVRLGKPGRRVNYRVNLDTESSADGDLRRISR